MYYLHMPLTVGFFFCCMAAVVILVHVPLQFDNIHVCMCGLGRLLQTSQRCSFQEAVLGEQICLEDWHSTLSVLSVHSASVKM